MKVVRTDRELECPVIDRVLRDKGTDLVLLPDTVTEDELASEVADADLLLMCYMPITATVISRADKLKAIVKYGVGIDAIALAYVLSFPWAHLVLSGAARAEHLLSNLRAGDTLLSEGQMGELNRLAMPVEAYWAERSGLAWN